MRDVQDSLLIAFWDTPHRKSRSPCGAPFCRKCCLRGALDVNGLGLRREGAEYFAVGRGVAGRPRHVNSRARDQHIGPLCRTLAQVFTSTPPSIDMDGPSPIIARRVRILSLMSISFFVRQSQGFTSYTDRSATSQVPSTAEARRAGV